jgi:hypothetical protein
MTMIYRFRRPRVFLACLTGVLLATLGGARPGSAQDTAKPGVTEQAGSLASSRNRGDGIKVHGHWTIDVRNPDGTLASHNEIDNDLIETAKPLLSRLLAKEPVLSEWVVTLDGHACEGYGAHTICVLAEPTSRLYRSDEGPWVSNTLALAATSVLELTGNTIVTYADAIGAFRTTAYHVFDDGQFEQYDFSGKTLTTPIEVTAGQHVYVKVTYSFSS